MKVIMTVLSLLGLKGYIFPVTNILDRSTKGAYALLEPQPIFCFLNYSFFKEGIKYNSKATDSVSSFHPWRHQRPWRITEGRTCSSACIGQLTSLMTTQQTLMSHQMIKLTLCFYWPDQHTHFEALFPSQMETSHSWPWSEIVLKMWLRWETQVSWNTLVGLIHGTETQWCSSLTTPGLLSKREKKTLGWWDSTNGPSRVSRPSRASPGVWLLRMYSLERWVWIENLGPAHLKASFDHN